MSHTGGTERVLSLVANGLAKRNYEIVVISMWGEKHTGYPLDSAIKRYRLAEEYPKGVKRNIDNICSLWHIVNKEQISVLVDVDLILVFYTLPVRLLKKEVKTISWEHFNYYYVFRKNNRIRRLAMRLAAISADAFVVLSKEDLHYYKEKLYFRKRPYQIYNPNTYENVACKEPKEKMILAAGRLTRAKGFDYLLESWALLEKDFPDWKLCIAGDGEEKKALQNEEKKLGLEHVLWLGEVSDIEKYYEKSAFFVLPSRNEGFGMVLIEAMAYGNPVVSFACKAGPKDIVHDGKDGFLVPTGDVTAFAEKMRCLMESGKMRDKMGGEAKKATERFCLDGILDCWEKLFREL